MSVLGAAGECASPAWALQRPQSAWPARCRHETKRKLFDRCGAGVTDQARPGIPRRVLVVGDGFIRPDVAHVQEWVR